jgi:hypothetical protein
MAEYFTLDPAYEQYEVGVTELNFGTVFNKGSLSHFSSIHFFVTIGLLSIAIVFVAAQAYISGKLRPGNRSDDIILIILCAIFGGFVLITVRQFIVFLRTQNKLNHLLTAGSLIEGTIVNFAVNTKPAYWRGEMPTKYYKVDYAFTTPDLQHLHGTQIKMIKETESIPRNPNQIRTINAMGEDETPYWVPAQGTSIRVLYADPETYVML